MFQRVQCGEKDLQDNILLVRWVACYLEIVRSKEPAKCRRHKSLQGLECVSSGKTP